MICSGAQQGPARQPFAHGIFFGLTNPKAYPVAVATFTALLSSRAELLESWADVAKVTFTEGPAARGGDGHMTFANFSASNGGAAAGRLRVRRLYGQ